MGFCFNCNHDKCNTIASYETIFFDRVYYYDFMEACYIVQDVLKDNTFKDFDIDISDGWNTEKYAFEAAARYYNSLVPDSEKVPIF